jgi:hypothetical protein
LKATLQMPQSVGIAGCVTPAANISLLVFS